MTSKPPCGETHTCCKARLEKEGGKARCCYCVPHEDCDFTPTTEMEKRINARADFNVKHGYTPTTEHTQQVGRSGRAHELQNGLSLTTTEKFCDNPKCNIRCISRTMPYVCLCVHHDTPTTDEDKIQEGLDKLYRTESAADGGWEKEFENNRPDRAWLPPDILKSSLESPLKLFGYRYSDGKNIHEVTDWGNIKSFISNLLRKEREAAQRQSFEAQDTAYERGKVEGAKAEREACGCERCKSLL